MRLSRLAATACGLLALTAVPATAANEASITLMETSDLHGNVLNWDYFTNTEFTDSAGNDVGLAKVATLVNRIRADRGREHTMLLDSGDILQGTPLDYYFAK